MLPARLRHCHVELACQRLVRHDEPGESRAVLYGPRHPVEGSAASRFVTRADRLVCAGTVPFIGAATVPFIGAGTVPFIGAATVPFIGAASRVIGAAATAYGTTRRTEAHHAKGRRSAATFTATVA
jgi:hypothetical protein